MKIKKSEKGVSEVVGSILILMITITMFAVVMLWVLSYPTPSGRAYVDLNAEVNGQYVNITHLGGEPLEDDDTAIYVYINGSLAGGKSYKISDADNYATIGDSFSVGETWSKIFSISSTSTVGVTIVDTKGSEVIFDKTLQGVSGNNPPVVAFACTVPSSVPADGATTFKVYAYILDPDKDVSTVTVDLSSVGKSTYNMTSTDGVIFQKSSLTISVGTSAGRYLCQINATDSNGNIATGYVQITVTTPANLTDIHDYFGWVMEDDEGATGYDIYNETGLVTRVGTRVFLQGETIYMQVGSLTLRKIKIQNSFVLYDNSFEKLEPQTREYEPLNENYVEGGPLDEPAFYDIATPNSKYYMYEYNCTAPSTAGQYLVYAAIKDTAGHVFITWDTIYVCKSDGSVPNYPKIVTCKDPNSDNNLSDLEISDEFNFTEKMYVKIVTMDVNNISSPKTAMGDVEINNFRGTWHIKKKLDDPPTAPDPPLSALFFDSNISSLSWDERDDGNNFYTFSINLLEPNQYNWLKGTNTYVLLIRYFNDNNEEYGILATLVKVKGRASTIDIIATIGSQGSGWSSGESQVCWYSGDEYWDRTTISGAPTGQWWTVKAPRALAVGDIDGDGDNDVVVGMDDDRDANLVWFENLEPDGSDWLAHFVNTSYGGERYRIRSVALADLDFDGDLEIIAGTMKQTGGWLNPSYESTGVHVYVNDGDWTDITMMPMTGGVAKPTAKGSQDNTSSDLESVLLNDDEYYNVSGNKTLFFDSWNITGMSGTITGVILHVQYKTDSNYVGNESIKWALNGQPLANTTITFFDTTKEDPDNPDKEYIETFNLYGQGVDTFLEIASLDISFHHNGYTLYKDNATSENSIIGYVLNRYTDTWVSDNVRESIKEKNESGINQVLHEWAIPLTSRGYAWTFNIEAYCDHTSEQDNFTFYYSTDKTNWTEMLTVNATSDPNTCQTYTFPENSLLGVSTIYIRVNDTNKNATDNASDEQDTLYVDRMYIETRTSANVYIDYMWIDVIATSGATKDIMDEIEIADIDGNGRPDIVGAAEDGETVIYFNNVADPANRNISAVYWKEKTIGSVSAPKDALHLLEIGYFEGTGDNDLDVVRTNGNNLYVYKNPGPTLALPNPWTRDDYDPTGDRSITALAAGDMNGDGLADITVGTLMINKNDRPQLWQIRQNVSGTLDPAIRIRTVKMNSAIDTGGGWAGKTFQISDIEIGDIDGDGDNDTVIGVQLNKYWNSWGTTISNNLWCYYNNCTNTTPNVDPDGAGPSGAMNVLWYDERMLYINPWDQTSTETVYNIELGYIDT